MRLYTDGTLTADPADAASLDESFGRFAALEAESLELRGAPSRFLRATRDRSGVWLELALPTARLGFGVADAELEEARAAFEDFLHGLTPALSEEDCPLCRLEAETRHRA